MRFDMFNAWFIYIVAGFFQGYRIEWDIVSIKNWFQNDLWLAFGPEIIFHASKIMH